MSGWPFDDKKNKDNNIEKDDESSVFEEKNSYVGKITGFLESGVREMTKDIKKL
jgi:hypothetical protein